jgi:hypothetical protein
MVRPGRLSPDQRAVSGILLSVVRCESKREGGATTLLCGPPRRLVQAKSKSELPSIQYESELITSPPLTVVSDCQTPLPDAETGKHGAVVLAGNRFMLGGL